MPSLRPLPALLLPLALVACTEPDETHTAFIAGVATPCQGEAPQLCLEAVIDGSGVVERFYGGIEGFTFRWGVESTIVYRVEDVEDPPADGSSQRLILEEVVEERLDVVDQFALVFAELGPGSTWLQAGATPGEVTLVGSTRVACTEPTCSALLELGPDARVGFEVTGATDVPLRATGFIAY